MKEQDYELFHPRQLFWSDAAGFFCVFGVKNGVGRNFSVSLFFLLAISTVVEYLLLG